MTPAFEVPPITGESTANHLPPHGLAAVAWCGVGFAAFFHVLRVYVRLQEARRLFPDDFWMFGALVILVINSILQTLQNPSLYHIFYVSIGQLPPDQESLVQGTIYSRYGFAITGLFWTVLWCVKASFLSLFYRLFDGLPKYRRIWWAVTVFTGLAYAGCWIANLFQCHPPSSYFHFGECPPEMYKVGSNRAISYSTAVDILTDLMIMSLPLRLLSSLQVSRPQKIALGVVFCIGLIIIAVAIIRLTQIVGKDQPDPVGFALWALVESSVSVIVGSLPPLKSFLGRVVKSTRRRYGYGSSREGKTKTSSGGSKAVKGSWVASQHIPLDKRTEAKHGDIVVHRDFGWENEDRDGSKTESVSVGDGELYDDEGRLVDRGGAIGMAHTTEDIEMTGYSTKKRESELGKTSWLT